MLPAQFICLSVGNFWIPNHSFLWLIVNPAECFFQRQQLCPLYSRQHLFSLFPSSHLCQFPFTCLPLDVHETLLLSVRSISFSSRFLRRYTRDIRRRCAMIATDYVAVRRHSDLYGGESLLYERLETAKANLCSCRDAPTSSEGFFSYPHRYTIRVL